MKGRKHKNKKMIAIISVAVVAVSVIGGVGLSALGKNKNQTDNGAQFKTVTVERRDISLNVTASGNIEGVSSTIISSDVNALINSMEVSVGDYIQEGDVLFGLDVEYLEEKLEEAEDQLDSQEDSLNEQYDTAEGLYEIAPISGYITEVNVKVGENASSISKAYGSSIQIAEENVMEVEVNWAGYYEANEGEEMVVSFAGVYEPVSGYVYEKGKKYIVRINSVMYEEGTYVDVHTTTGAYLGHGEVNVPDEYVYNIAGNGDVSNIYVQEGQYVSRGTKLLKYENINLSNQISNQKETIENQEETITEIKELIENPYIVSNTSGIVSKSYVNVSDGGAKIQEDASLLEIVDGNALQVTVSVDELDVVTLEEGMAADVNIDAFPDNTYVGKLTSISKIGKTSGDVTYYDAVVQLVEPSDEILVGMSASTEIKVQSVENVLSVPVSALQYRMGKYFVYVPVGSVSAEQSSEITDTETKVLSANPAGGAARQGQFSELSDEERQKMKEQMQQMQQSGDVDVVGTSVDEGEATLVPVEIGLMDEFYAEITSGLSEGQEILVPEKASTNTEDQMKMPGMGPMGGGMGNGNRPNADMSRN